MYIVMLPMKRAWLNDPTSPSTPMPCGTRSSTDETDNLDGEFRSYAGNITQMVVRETTTRVRQIWFAALTGAQYAQIKAWRGQVLLLRTIDGDRIFGGYLDVTKHRYYHVSVDGGATQAVFDAEVSFTEVTYDESV